MQILFVIILIFALLGGILNKCDSGHSSSGGSFFNIFGIKSKEQIEKERLEKVVADFFKTQNQYLGDSQEESGALSKVIEEASSLDKNGDLLRLKSLVTQFEDQNVLMVENGKDIMAFKQKQDKINKKMAEEADLASFLSNGRQKEILEKQRDAMEKQREIMSKLHAQIEQMRQDPSKNTQFINKLDGASNKISSSLERLKEQQERMQDMKQNNLDRYESMKENLQSSQERNKDKMRDMKDRIQDQLERAKDRRRN